MLLFWPWPTLLFEIGAAGGLHYTRSGKPIGKTTRSSEGTERSGGAANPSLTIATTWTGRDGKKIKGAGRGARPHGWGIDQ
jgi:hypothetical protein